MNTPRQQVIAPTDPTLWNLHKLPAAPRLTSGELLWSYVQRLGHANNVDPDFLDQWILDLGVPGGWAACLATLTGESENSVREAIIDLAVPHAVVGARSMLAEHDDHTQVWQCLDCLAGKQINEPAQCWVPFHHKACVRHKRWLNPVKGIAPPQPDEIVRLAWVPEVVAAQQCLNRMARRYAPGMLRRGYEEAYAVVIRWAATDHTDDHGRWRRLDRLMGDGSKQRVLIDDPALSAALLPDTVRLAAVVADPHWREVATSPDLREHRALERELDRRAGVLGFQPDSRQDPLNRWLRVQENPGVDVGWLRPESRPRWPNSRPATPPDPGRTDTSSTTTIQGYRASVLTAETPAAGLTLLQLADVICFYCSGFCQNYRYSDWIAEYRRPGLDGRPTRARSWYCRRCYTHILDDPSLLDYEDSLVY